jgi:hypothetical protein
MGRMEGSTTVIMCSGECIMQMLKSAGSSVLNCNRVDILMPGQQPTHPLPPIRPLPKWQWWQQQVGRHGGFSDSSFIS